MANALNARRTRPTAPGRALSRSAAIAAAVVALQVPHAARAQAASAPVSGASPGSGAPALPPPPVVDDPMLAPVPPPKRVVGSWSEAVSLLRARSTDLRIALDAVLKAEGLTRTALAQYLPSIGAAGSYTHQFLTNRGTSVPVLTETGVAISDVVPIPNTLAGHIQATQNVLNVAALDQISVDELNEDAARLSAADRKRTLVLGLANAIVAVVTAERAAELTRVGLRVALEQSEIVDRKQGLGGATAIDVVRAQQNAENARATLVSGDEVLHQAREALGIALGFPEETGVSHELSVGEIAADAQAVCPSVRSIEERPDVASARANLDVAKRNLRNVWYGFLPTVTAASTLSATTVVAQGSPNPTWNVQGLLTVPIWDGGGRYGTVRVARAEEDTAAQELEALRRDGLIQVEQAQRGLVVAQAAYHVAVRQRDLSARNDVLNQMAYLAGQGTSLELVTASEAHREAELNLALKEFGVVRSRLLAALALAACP